MTELSVNGQVRSIDADADTPLLWVLRDDLGLPGTKFGCGEACAEPAPCIWTGKRFGLVRHPSARWVSARLPPLRHWEETTFTRCKLRGLPSRYRNAGIANQA